MTKFLLEGEVVLHQLDYNIILTNFRIRYRSSNSSTAHVVSMMLECISAIEIHYISKFYLKLLAVMAMLGGLFSFGANEVEMGIGAFVIGLVFAFFYWSSRSHVISISSNGGIPLNVVIKGMAFNAVLEFLNKTEQAKRYNYEELFPEMIKANGEYS